VKPYEHLEITDTFLESLISKGFSPREQALFVKALQLLDDDEHHPSLRVHPLHGKEKGTWSASASDELRVTFERKAGGLKTLIACTRHYQ